MRDCLGRILLTAFTLGAASILTTQSAAQAPPLQPGEKTPANSPEQKSQEGDATNGVVTRHGKAIAFAVSSDASLFAMAPAELPNQIRVLDSKTGSTVATLLVSEDAPTVSLHFDREATLLARVSERTVTLWQISQPMKPDFEWKIPDDFGPTRLVEFSPKGDRLAVAGESSDSNTIVLDRAGNELQRIFLYDQPNRVAFGSESKSLLVFYDDAVHHWKDGEEPDLVLGSAIEQVAVSGGHNYLAIRTSNRLWLWDLNNVAPIDRVDDKSLTDVWLSPNERHMVTTSKNGDLDVFETNVEGKLTHVRVLTGLKSGSPTFSPDGSLVAYVSDDETVTVGELANGNSSVLEMFRFHVRSDGLLPLRVDFDPRGKHLLTTYTDGRLAWWDISSQGVVWERVVPELDRCWLCPSGDVALIRTQSGEFISLDISGAMLRRRQYNFDMDPRQLLFAPDGRYFAFRNSYLRSVMVVSTETGKRLGLVAYDANQIQFTADGKVLYMLGSNGAAHFRLTARTAERVNEFRLGATLTPGSRVVPGILEEREKERRPVLYDPATGLAVSEEHLTHVTRRGLWATSFDGRLLARVGPVQEGKGYGLEVVDVATGKSVSGFSVDIDSYVGVSFTPDADAVLIATSLTVERVNYRKSDRRTLVALPKPKVEPERRFNGIANIMSSVRDNMVAGGASRRYDDIKCMDVSANGWVALGHDSGAVTIWNSSTGKQVLLLRNPPNSIPTIAISADARFLACSAATGGLIHMFDLKGRLPARAEPEPEESPTNALKLGF